MDIASIRATSENQLAKMRSKRYKYPFRFFLQRRAFHAYCVGTPKSGTHSIAEMLSNYRTSHEADEILMINLIGEKLNNKLSRRYIQNVFQTRDTFHWFEMESSHYLGAFTPELSPLFIRAKFILTIRDCISWVDSWFNHQLSRPALAYNSAYNYGRNNYYSKGHSYTRHDHFLENYKLFPLKSYFKFWAEHNSRILDHVPSDRLLIIKTNEISHSSKAIANFLNIPSSTIISEKSHSYKAKKKYDILRQVDRNYLFDVAMEICGDLNDKLFSESTIQKTISDHTE